MTELIKEEDGIDLLPEEIQAQAICDIKKILEAALLKNTGQKEMVAAVVLKLDSLVASMTEANNMSYRHEIHRDNYGKAEYLITSPIKVRLKAPNG